MISRYTVMKISFKNTFDKSNCNSDFDKDGEMQTHKMFYIYVNAFTIIEHELEKVQNI